MIVKNADHYAPHPEILIHQLWARKTIVIYYRTFPLLLWCFNLQKKQKQTQIPTRGEITHTETAC